MSGTMSDNSLFWTWSDEERLIALDCIYDSCVAYKYANTTLCAAMYDTELANLLHEWLRCDKNELLLKLQLENRDRGSRLG